MVLAERIGKRRRFWAGLLLSIATAGIYGIYWNYKAHAEVYRQFEISKENRDDGVLWYVLGIVLPPFLVAYAWVMAANVAYVRERMRLRRSMTPAKFVTLVSIGFGTFFAAELVFVVIDLFRPAEDPLVSTAAGLVALSALVFVATVPYAYWRLQKDINELWDAYDARMRELTDPPAEAARAAAPAAEGTQRYLADLGPSTRP